ncbi:hypothetical protein L208DRAFT_1512701 [Tricholoma matsutake]|nr:hypothetical protein L208DRAFT_1512701 [Tricholoma matsutake 945]
MPVMICTNSATELSMTKGQEPIVHSWEYITNAEGKKILDTLFVCLVNPPTNVHFDDLPMHVVLLTRTSVTTSVRLPDDTYLKISRNQVEILPNFAMTDYASQGKTHFQNVVDLGHSDSHQAYYTALSRGTTAAGTLILSGFHPQKIQGGASGALRQEFHELELLDEITTLQFYGNLNTKIMVEERHSTLIAAFRKMKGEEFVPKLMHRTLQWGPGDPYLEWAHTHKETTTDSLGKHREGPEAALKQPFKKQKKSGNSMTTNVRRDSDLFLVSGLPEGTQWSNNSCAYDAIITVLFNTWKENPLGNNEAWSEINNSLMIELINGFNNYMARLTLTQQGQTLENVREQMQQRLISISTEFGFGLFTSISSVLQLVLQYNEAVTSCMQRCTVPTHPAIQERLNNRTCLITTFPSIGQSLQQHLDNFQHKLGSHCSVCNQQQIRITTFHCLPPLLAFEWPAGVTPSLPDIITVTAEDQQTFALKGVIYYGQNHFTAHVKLRSGTWYHDGMVTGCALTLQPLLQQNLNTPICAIYSRLTIT